VSSHHDYPATDILAPVGTRVVSVVDGVVDFVSRTDEWRSASNDPALRGGLSVAIVGDDGIRYYASHLRDVAEGLTVGDRVEAGQPIGHVGTSGNARGTDAHVHFGISEPTRPDDWEVRRGQVSPFVYLNAWRDGNDLTPAVPGAGTPRCRRVQS
jgi:murein DD-endopeptidase MepM/ murein hydrolase activator NlpD